ncbi:MAG TPA: TetR/AcrR family transcriptional regulator [Pirellulaceae bacterium]|nr:TetR/AcrR family transcriptional regulator [Pirellulaceae bacterium]
METEKPSPSQQRRARQQQKTRQMILDHATRVLLKHGVDGFSMRKLADRIGYSPTAIYFHFADKDSLLGEVVERQFMTFRGMFEKVERIKEPLRRLVEMGMTVVEFGLRHPDSFRLMFLQSHPTIPKGRLVERGNPSQDCYAFLLSTVCEALEAGQFRPELKDAEQLAQIFFAAVHGVVTVHLVKGDDPWIDWRPVKPKARILVEGLVRGLSRSG